MKNDEFIEDIITDMSKKTPKKLNKLNGLRFYLAGPIDAAKETSSMLICVWLMYLM